MRKRSSGSARREMLVNPAVLIVFCVSVLTLLGISVLFSATAHFGSDPYYFLKRQLIWLVIAIAACAFTSMVNLEYSRRFAWVVGLVMLVGLILVLIPGIGVMVNGSRRWLPLGPMRLQVSEFAKLGMVFVLAVYVGANQRHMGTFLRGFFLPCLMIGVTAGLIILQPDYGMAALCAAVGMIMLFLAGSRLVFLVPTVVSGIILFFTALYLSPVRWRRIMAFIDVEGNRSDGAYQLWQAILAFGAGGVHGSGLGNGRQQMAFLPEAHTDFIFAVIGEELGLIFTGLVLVLFFLIFLVGARHLGRAPNLYQYLLLSGALLLVSLQALINMGVVTGCLPTKGMSLPFISYGGSNLVVMFMIVGLFVNTANAWRKPVLRQRERRLKEILA